VLRKLATCVRMRVATATFLAGVALWSLPPAAHALGPDPAGDWRTADTPHFSIHFRAEHRGLAQQVATIAERVYPRITRQLNWEPRSATHVLVLGELDIANGLTTPLPFDVIALFMSPPVDGELLDNSRWLEILVTHEFTHAVHLDKARGAPGILRRIFGRVPWLFPNLFQPTWVMEGLAVYNESDPAHGIGRLGSPAFEGELAVEREGGFKPLSRINASGREGPLNKDYLYGAYFMEFLARRYGRQAVADWIERYSGNLVPRFHTGPEDATGKTMDVLWDEFLVDLRARTDARAARLGANPDGVSFPGEPLGEAAWDIPALAPADAGAALAIFDDGIHQPKLERVDPTGARRVLVWVRSGTRLSARTGPVAAAVGTGGKAGAAADAAGAAGAADSDAAGAAGAPARGAVQALLAMPEFCGAHALFYDLYRWTEADGLRRLTHCAHTLRAVWAGGGIVALRSEAGRTALIALDAAGRQTGTLLPAQDDVDLIDLAAAPDGRRVVVALKRGGRWELAELAVEDALQGGPAGDAAPGAPVAAPRALQRLLAAPGPITELRAIDGNQWLFVAAVDGAANLWRYRRGAAQVERLTRTTTAITASSGVLADGAVMVVQDEADGARLRRLTPDVLQRSSNVAVAAWSALPLSPGNFVVGVSGPDEPGAAPLAAGATAQPAAAAAAPAETAAPPATATTAATTPANAAPADATLRDERSYHALATMAPRMWLPAVYIDRGLTAYGASTAGSDAMFWHQYALTGMWETRQHEPIAAAAYAYDDLLFLDLKRDLRARAWTGDRGNERTTLYERSTNGQAVIAARYYTYEIRSRAGLGAALDRVERVVVPDNGNRFENRKLGAAFVDVDATGSNWLSEGLNVGAHATLLYESYAVFKSGNDYDGSVTRFDVQGYVPLGRTVLALRGTEARAHGRTEPYQLGGGSAQPLQLAPVALNVRDLALRGYGSNEVRLQGPNARTASVEWRTPLSDIDRHTMVPPWGINRVSMAVFLDVGGVWTSGSKPDKLFRGVGAEALAEIRLLYQIPLLVRLGVARGLDEPRDTQVYLKLGRAF
jgi:hypothetical protein